MWGCVWGAWRLGELAAEVVVELAGVFDEEDDSESLVALVEGVSEGEEEEGERLGDVSEDVVGDEVEEEEDEVEGSA